MKSTILDLYQISSNNPHNLFHYNTFYVSLHLSQSSKVIMLQQFLHQNCVRISSLPIHVSRLAYLSDLLTFSIQRSSMYILPSRKGTCSKTVQTNRKTPLTYILILPFLKGQRI